MLKWLYRSFFILVGMYVSCSNMLMANLPETVATNFRTFSQNDKLPSNQIFDIQQDHNGFIWIATANGLSRYDGHQVITYQTQNNKNSISGNDTVSLAIDKLNKVWVATNNSVDFYDYRSNSFTNILNPKTHVGNQYIEIIHRILSFKDKIFVTTNLGLLQLDLNGNLEKTFNNNSDSLPSKRVIRLFNLKNNKLLVSGFEDGLWLYHSASDNFTQFIHNINELPKDIRNIRGLIELKNKTIWLMTNKGILQVDDEGRQLSILNRDNTSWIKNDIFQDIVVNNNQELIVSTYKNGLYYLNPKGMQIKHILPDKSNVSLPSRVTKKLFLAKNNVLWVATDNAGIGLWNQNEKLISRIDYLDDQSTLMDGLVWSVLNDRDNDLWIGTDSGLNLWQQSRQRFQHFHIGKTTSGANSEVSVLAQQDNGTIWMATALGLKSYNKKTDQFKSYKSEISDEHGLASTFIYSLHFDQHNRLWIGHDAGASFLDLKTGKFQHFSYQKNDPHSLPNNNVGIIAEDQQHHVWLGTSKGICRFMEGPQNFDCVLRGVGGNTTSSTFLVNGLIFTENTMWVGYSGNGIIKKDLSHPKTAPVHYSINNGFPTNNIASMKMDGRGRLWISSQTGLFVFNTQNGQIINLKASDGTGDSEFNEGAVTKLKDGRLAFGTVKGVVIVDADKFNFKKTSPQVKISGIYSLSGEKLYSMGQYFEIPEKNSGLIFSFSNQDYFHPEQSMYQYRLGKNRAWINLKNKSEISFDGFSWGDHTFEVRGKYLGGDWGPSVAVKFHTFPPSWRSTFALMFYGVVALSLIIGFFTYRHLQNREKYKMHKTIRENEQQLRMSLDASRQAVWNWRINNDHMQRVQADKILKTQVPDTLVDYWSMIEDKDRLNVINAWNAHLFGQTQYYHCQYRLKNEQGEEIWIEEQGKAIDRDDKGMAIRISGTYRNITEQKQLENKLNLLAKAFEDTAEGVLVTDETLTVVQVNNAVTKITGYPEKTLIGYSLLQPGSKKVSLEEYEAIWNEVREKGLWQGEIWQVNAEGEEIPLWLNVSDIQNEEEKQVYYVLIISDIRQRKEAEEELRYLANYDTLTQLPNRALLRDRMDHALNNAKRRHKPIAVLFLDLDRFKQVNDSFGHSVGDGLLIAVSERLKGCLRDDDTVSRLGGDEFVILMEHFSSISAIAGVTEKIRKAMSSPFNLEGVDIQSSFSIGVSVFPGDGEDSTSLLRNADTAMYHAKTSGRNRVQFYAPKMNETALERLTLENDLRSAIGSGQLEVYYQPQVNSKDNTYYGVEALVRWNHPEKGLIFPNDFIPMAEESDLIVSLGNEILYKACAQMKKWQDKYGLKMKVSINMAARQLLQIDLAQHILNVVNRTGLEPDNVCLEITETAVMEDLNRSKKILTSLQEKGFKIAIDDFGTGYSSLNYLRNIPLDILKIDYTFVRELLQNNVDQAIVSAIIEIGEALNLEVLAEGVEEEAQKDLLIERGCQFFQGYYYGKPMTASNFEQILDQGNGVING